MSAISQTEILDTLYLEWSQFTEVRTLRETQAKETLNKVITQMQARAVEQITQDEWINLHTALVQIMRKL
jgi:hypothetical protein